MQQLNPNYVTDNANKKVAVQLSIDTYLKIEEVLENFGLYHLLVDNDARNTALLSLEEAKDHYKTLKKKK